jgi:hypothetical protein
MIDTGAVIRGLGRRGARGTAVLIALIPLAVACASTGYTYVKSSEDNTYFRIPDTWELFDEDDLVELLPKSVSAQAVQRFRDSAWRVGFDANPNPSVNHIFQPKASFPAGRATVQRLSADQSDVASAFLLRNFIVEIDTLVEGGVAAIISEERIERDGGFHGVQVVAELVANTRGRQIVYQQVSLLDQASTKVYSLIISCESDCYEEHERDINRVIDSWTVEE